MDDICLILEGTYPFVRGGVSSWVHNLIEALPEFSFCLIAISASSDTRSEPKYDIPPNVHTFVETFLQDVVVNNKPVVQRGKKKDFWKTLEKFWSAPLAEKSQYYNTIIDGMAIDDKRILNSRGLLYSREVWEIITRQYEKQCPNASFMDYFWTWRFIQLPILQMLNTDIPPARVYHTVCTGYAGLVGIVARRKYNSKLILTEHGIYTKERQIEISRADWIYTEKSDQVRARKTPGIFKQMWIENFMTLGKLCYDYADAITTIYGGNKELEISFGAEASKITVVPNGVDLAGFSRLTPGEGLKSATFKVGLVGRVVPIKDIKTFIKACKIVADVMPNVEFFVIGPTEEDEQYYQECLDLTDMLKLTDRLKFTGKVNVKEYYPVLDIMALTSISEGQPLTILEAMCVGVAIVASDVGACSELVHGYTEADKALGACGIITAIGKPRETGEAILTILNNTPLREQMIQAGLTRVNQYYDQQQVVNYYRDLYTNLIKGS